MHRTVPMLLRVLVESPDDDGKKLLSVFVDEFHHVVVVPEEESAFSYLKMRTCDASGNAAEERMLHLVELSTLSELQSLFQLIEEEYLL
mmetsp:Transcript_26748/g.61625  ORF Transcript_26748/g.61625 Transcript_26748/m.61625 type:complete len:89 (+) Transcript_26748:238-504(+)